MNLLDKRREDAKAERERAKRRKRDKQAQLDRGDDLGESDAGKITAARVTPRLWNWYAVQRDSVACVEVACGEVDVEVVGEVVGDTELARGLFIAMGGLLTFGCDCDDCRLARNELDGCRP